jgi:glutathione S-transferase
MLTLHQYHLSPFNEKVQRMLNYKGVPFKEQYWRLADRKKVQAFNPTGKLPALEHDGHWICDSTDMAHYIERTFPQHPLIPDDPRLAGMVHVLEDWADESLYFYEMHLRFTTPGNQERNLPRMVEHENAFLRWLLPKVIPNGIRKITANQGIGRKTLEQILVDTERHVQAIDNLLRGADWLVGDRLSLADLAVYAMFQCFRDADNAFTILQRYPAVTAWMDRIEQATDQRAA